jgi:hypothetical protein
MTFSINDDGAVLEPVLLTFAFPLLMHSLKHKGQSNANRLAVDKSKS